MSTRRLKLERVAGWSCDERDRTACRNPHGCHCAEITALRYSPEETRARNYERDKLAPLPSSQEQAS